MANEILCPACDHSLGFHPYEDEDGCQAPLGGLTSHNKCGCPMTLHIFIQGLQKENSKRDLKELEEIKLLNQMYIDEMASSRTVLANGLARIHFLENLLNNIRGILNEAKLVDHSPFYGHFKINYKKEMHKLLDKALLEMERNE